MQLLKYTYRHFTHNQNIETHSLVNKHHKIVWQQSNFYGITLKITTSFKVMAKFFLIF